MTPSNHRRNPFHVLGLPVDATNAQIVERAEELVQTCHDAAERDLVVWAKGELITHPLVRARHERTEPGRTDYEREQRWEDFVHDHRRGPVSARTLAVGAPLRTEDFDLAAVVRILTRWSADAELEAVDPLLCPLPATEADGVTRLEVRDVLFG